MADLVNDHTDEAVFNVAAIGELAGLLVLGRTIAVEADHRIFHAATFPRVDRLRGRIGVRERQARIAGQRVCHSLRRIMRPDRLGLIGIKRHRHHQRHARIVLMVAHSIPNKLTRRRPAKVSNVLRLELPGTGAGGMTLFVGCSFGWCDNEHRLFGCLGALEAGALFSG